MKEEDLLRLVWVADPQVSPDGKWLGFWHAPTATLRKVALTGGAPIKICNAFSGIAGAAWGPDETIVFVAVWIDAGAGDETAVRTAARRATRKAVGMAVTGRDPAAARDLAERRDGLRSPYYSGS